MLDVRVTSVQAKSQNQSTYSFLVDFMTSSYSKFTLKVSFVWLKVKLANTGRAFLWVLSAALPKKITANGGEIKKCSMNKSTEKSSIKKGL
jgi:hypothetical protein